MSEQGAIPWPAPNKARNGLFLCPKFYRYGLQNFTINLQLDSGQFTGLGTVLQTATTKASPKSTFCIVLPCNVL